MSPGQRSNLTVDVVQCGKHIYAAWYCRRVGPDRAGFSAFRGAEYRQRTEGMRLVKSNRHERPIPVEHTDRRQAAPVVVFPVVVFPLFGKAVVQPYLRTLFVLSFALVVPVPAWLTTQLYLLPFPPPTEYNPLSLAMTVRGGRRAGWLSTSAHPTYSRASPHSAQ